MEAVSVISNVIILAGIFLFLFACFRAYEEMLEIKRDVQDCKKILKDAYSEERLNNGCDCCCRDCDDKFSCSGACIHADEETPDGENND